MTLEERFLRRQDLALYHSLAAFRGAHSVLELGCGSGAALSTLARLFPEKRFAGVDASEPLIRLACLDSRAPNIEYHHQNPWTMHPDDWAGFDFIIARFIGSRTAPKDFLAQCASLLADDGHLLVYEASDAQTVLYPEVPERVSAFVRLQRIETEVHRHFSAARHAQSEAWRHGFTPVEQRRIVHPAETDTDKQGLSALLDQVISPLISAGEEKEHAAATQGVARWARTADTYGQFGARAVLLTKRNCGVYSRSRRTTTS